MTIHREVLYWKQDRTYDGRGIPYTRLNLIESGVRMWSWRLPLSPADEVALRSTVTRLRNDGWGVPCPQTEEEQSYEHP